MRRIVAALAASFLTAGLSGALSQEGERVDVQLVLAVDISASMQDEELEIQREGYAAALIDPEVLKAITGGAHGRIAVTFFEYAGVTTQNLVIPWTIVGDEAEARQVADRISAHDVGWQPRRTSISGALDFGAKLIAESPYKGLKKVIDVSGDGTNNEGPHVDLTRDAVIARGIVINGLPMVSGVSDIEDLGLYYERCVTGGPGSFVLAIDDWKQFPAAIRRKFLMEIARKPPASSLRLPVVLAQAATPYDCQIGEKLWRDSPNRRKYNPEKFQWPMNEPENFNKWKQ